MPDKKILKNCNIVRYEDNNEKRDVLYGRDILLSKKGKISSIKEDLNLDDVNEYEFNGCFVIPGVIDCHMHLVSECLPTNRHGDDDERFYRVVDNLRKNLKSGITTVRDLNAPDQTVIRAGEAVEEGMIKGSRVIACGQGICCTGGHFSGSCREADGKNEIRKAVREQIERGASVIKLMATSSSYKNGGLPEMSLEEIKAAVEVSNDQNIPVAAHAEGKKGILRSIDGGVDTIEHAKFMDREVAKELSNSDAYWIPTLKASKATLDNQSKWGDEKVEKSRKMVNRNKESMKFALEEDVKIAMGTDAGTSYNYHGENLHELELMNRYGMEEKHVIRSSTINAADALKIENLGKVKEGFIADLLILENNPLDKISNVKEIRNVVKEGVVYSINHGNKYKYL